MFQAHFVTKTAPRDITVKSLNSGHLRVLKNLSVIERCPLLEGNFKKIVTFGTKCFVCYSWHVRCLGCPLLKGFTVSSQMEAECLSDSKIDISIRYDLNMILVKFKSKLCVFLFALL